MRLPPAYCGLFLFSLLLIFGFGGVQVFGDPDTAWHIAAGDLIRSLHTVPREDPWSYAAQGEVWYNLSWLFDIGLSALFEQGGFLLLYVATLCVFSVSYTWMAYDCLRRGAGLLAVCITLLLALLLSFSSILARPNLISTLFTIALYISLCHHRTHRRLCVLVWLPGLMAIWANMHGGFLLAFPIMAIFLLEAWTKKDAVSLRVYGILIAACMAATLINPYGYGVYFGAYKTITGAFDKSFIVEWQSAKIGQDLPITLLLLLLLLVGDARDRSIPLSDRIMAHLLLIMSLASIRHATIAAALTMPYTSLRLTTALAQSSTGKRLTLSESRIMADMERADMRWLGVFMPLIALALLASPFMRDKLLDNPLGFPKKLFPQNEAAFVEQHYPHTRFMTDYNLGGYLDFLWRGRVKLFVDGRASSLFSKQTLQDYADFAINAHGFGGRAKAIAQQYQWGGLIIANDDPTSGDWHWNPDWKLVYQGDVAAVYIRNTPPH